MLYRFMYIALQGGLHFNRKVIWYDTCYGKTNQTIFGCIWYDMSYQHELRIMNLEACHGIPTML